MRFKVQFSQTGQALAVRFTSGEQSFPVSFGDIQQVTVHEGVEYYEGTYDVTPLITSQRLATNQKFMTDDVRIEMIPTREINNDAGGVTFIIGG